MRNRIPPTDPMDMTEVIDRESARRDREHISFAKDIGIILAAQVGVQLLGLFVRLPLLTNELGVDLYGTWSIILTTATLVAPMATLGFTMAIVRLLAAEKDNRRIRDDFLSAIFVVLAAGSILSLILVLCSGPLASFADNSDNSPFFKLGAFMVLTQALSMVALAYFRTFRQMKWFSALRLINAACSLGLMAWFLSLGWGIEGVILAVLVGDGLSIAISLFVVVRQIGLALPRFSSLGTYLRYGIPIIPNAAILWVIASSDRYMIGYFMESADVGIYDAAYKLAAPILMVIGPLGMVLFPTISKSYDEGDIDKTKTYLQYSLKYLVMLTVPAAVGLSILAAPLLQLLTSDEYASGSDVFPWIASGLAMSVFYQIGVYVIHLAKKTYWILILLSIGAALNILLNLLLIPHMGILGAAVATLVSYGVLGILTLLVGFRYFRFDLSLPFMLKSLLASALMAVAIWFFDPQGIAGVILATVLGALLYCGIILLLKGFNRDEVDRLKDLISWTDEDREVKL